METLRAEYAYTTEQLLDWSRRLHRLGRYPCDALRRYAIGLYQIHQAVDWRRTPSEYESNAAACIHVAAACEALEIPIEQHIRSKHLVDIEFGGGSDKELLYHISKLQGQLVYATNSAKIKRKSRFDKGIAAGSAAVIILILIGRIPPAYRINALYEAMEIMTGEL